MNPNQPPSYTPQPVPPPAPSAEEYLAPQQHDHGATRGGAGVVLRRIGFVVALLAVLGGFGFGAHTVLGVLDKEKTQLASQLAVQKETENLYQGDGTDILQIAPATTVVACPAGFEEGEDICFKKETKTADPTVYNCPAGYTKSGSGPGTECSKIVGGKKETKPASSGYNCPAGQERSGNGASTKCTRYEVVGVNNTYTCPTGFVKSGTGGGTVCTKSTNSTVTAAVIAACPSGYTKSGSGASTACKISKAATAGQYYSCPSGYTRSSATCSKTVNATAKVSYDCDGGVLILTSKCGVNASMKYTCSDGTVSGSTCVSFGPLIDGTRCTGGYVKTGSQCKRVTDATKKYSCTKGSLSGAYCVYGNAIKRTDYVCSSGAASGSGAAKKCKTTINATSNTGYSCADNYALSGKTCTRSADATLSCPAGHAKSGSGSKTTCLKVSIETKPSTVTSACPDGYTKSGDKCRKGVTNDATQGYTCPEGYTLAATECSRIVGGNKETTTPGKTYQCPDGFEQTGQGQSMKCAKEEEKTQSPETVYECKEGWQKRQAGATYDCVLLKV